MLTPSHPVPLTLTASECDRIQCACGSRLAAIDAIVKDIPRKRWPASVKAATLASYSLERETLAKLASAIADAYGREHTRARRAGEVS